MTGPARSSAASQRGFSQSQNWKPKKRRAKMVGEFVPTLMRPAFEKFGFPAATILTDWEAIAGSEIAAFTRPERLKWPRANKTGDEVSGKGATLVLRVAGARALEVEQMRSQLIDRINATFGYRAVSELRILQAPLLKAKVPRSVTSESLSTEDAPHLAGLADDRLKAALTRMAKGVKTRSARSGTASIG